MRDAHWRIELWWIGIWDSVSLAASLALLIMSIALELVFHTIKKIGLVLLSALCGLFSAFWSDDRKDR